MTSKNQSQITFTIGEEEVHMIFNNSSLNAMSKALFGNQRKAFDLAAVLAEINRVNEENFMFACKVIIYGGIVGYYLESDQPKPKYSFAEVGKLIGQMTEPELMEYTGKVWEAFLDDLGVNLEAIQASESDGDPVKKK